MWCLGWSILFEGIFPLVAPWATGDIIDVACYFVGALLVCRVLALDASSQRRIDAQNLEKVDGGEVAKL